MRLPSNRENVTRLSLKDCARSSISVHRGVLLFDRGSTRRRRKTAYQHVRRPQNLSVP